MSAPFPDLQVVNTFAALPAAFHTRLQPVALNAPRLLHVNRPFARQLGLGDDDLAHPDFLAVCAGQKPLPGGQTLASVYSGHQFGVWAGELGDGRAHLLGELRTPCGSWEWQLKGSGRTPYSRMGDGRAVLRSSVREYLASEAMAGLGIPTTRALAIVVSDDPVYRETVETAAIVSRLSPSFLRFGHFEHFARTPEQLQILLEYTVDHFYPECRREAGGARASIQDLALRFLDEVVGRTATLIAHWMTAGFCHGVMNTDNMSILGLTLDYGPFGFMDAFQADHVCNHSDTMGRYAWNAQPSVGNWNLYRLAGSLLGLNPDAAALRAVLDTYGARFQQVCQQNMAAKLGLRAWQEGDQALTDAWWALLHHSKADFTRAFRGLATALDDADAFAQGFSDPRAAQDWLQAYQARLQADARPRDERVRAMNAVNPVYVLRNHLAQQAIDAAAQGDAREISRLLALLRQPFDEQPGAQAYAQAAPQWAQGLQLSCSS